MSVLQISFNVKLNFYYQLCLFVAGGGSVEVCIARASGERHPGVPEGGRPHADHRPRAHHPHVRRRAGQGAVSHAGREKKIMNVQNVSRLRIKKLSMFEIK